MEREKQLNWLMENSGPVIRHRTASELMNSMSDHEIRKLRGNLLKCEQVKKWLGLFDPRTLHHSKSSAFENVIGKLCEFGINTSIVNLSKQLKPFRKQLKEIDYIFSNFYQVLIAGGLTRIGYRDSFLDEFLMARLDDIYRCAKYGSYDVYITQTPDIKIPKPMRGKPILKHEFSPIEGEYPLPLIHDVYALANFPPDLVTPAVKRKINKVIEYILDPRYQEFPRGYGYMLSEDHKRFWAMGWSVNLPGYNGFDMDVFDSGYMVQRMELMSEFKIARKHDWFNNCLCHLDSFRNNSGTYSFPKNYLKESRVGYYVCGSNMGLEEGRRTQKVLDLESTFRRLLLDKHH